MVSSTKIVDLPDNTSEQILNDLNIDDDTLSLISEPTIVNKTVNKFSSKTMEIYKEAAIVFALVFVLSNKSVISFLYKLPYINTFAPHSLYFNALIALIVSIIYIAIKHLIKFYYTL